MGIGGLVADAAELLEISRVTVLATRKSGLACAGTLAKAVPVDLRRGCGKLGVELGNVNLPLVGLTWVSCLLASAARESEGRFPLDHGMVRRQKLVKTRYDCRPRWRKGRGCQDVLESRSEGDEVTDAIFPGGMLREGKVKIRFSL